MKEAFINLLMHSVTCPHLA